MPAEQRGEMRSYAELKIPFSTQRGTDWKRAGKWAQDPINVRLPAARQTAVTNYDNPVSSQREYLQNMFKRTYNGFV